jgi:S1-C subfamily serine protease
VSDTADAAVARQHQADRLQRTLGEVDFGALFNRRKAVIGPPPNEMAQLAREGLEAVLDHREATPAQQQALELAIRVLRPVPLVRFGQLDDIVDAEARAIFPQWEPFRTRARPLLPSIGLISRLEPDGSACGVATGFLISSKYLVSNAHVVKALTLGTGALVPAQASVRFGQEFEGDEPDAIPLVAAVSHATLDVAVFELREPATDRKPLELNARMVDVGNGVATVGYPTLDPWAPPAVTLQFDGTFGVKRGAAGEILQVTKERVHHDCTTMEGNSGSPLLTLDTAELIAVHSDGFFMARNRAVRVDAAGEFLRPYARGATS